MIYTDEVLSDDRSCENCGEDDDNRSKDTDITRGRLFRRDPPSAGYRIMFSDTVVTVVIVSVL